jgi:putative glycosyltransferase (TIGR04348 family)
MLGSDCRIGISGAWQGEPCELLIALHARRSAASIDAFARAHRHRPLIVVLTGTDLYRDIHTDASARRSLQQASHLVVLQDQGVDELPVALRGKCVVIFQSAARLQSVPPPQRVLHVVSVGHLRAEKDPATYMRAARRLRERNDIRILQIGDALDPALGTAAQRTQAECPNYRWLGGLPRAAARQHIRRAQLLVNTSRMEGGAQVILEAVQSGTAVLASRIPGNVGMLGAGHAGLFELGDDAGLAKLLARARDEPPWLGALRAQTVARSPWFEPAEEQRRLVHLITTALETPQ